MDRFSSDDLGLFKICCALNRRVFKDTNFNSIALFVCYVFSISVAQAGLIEVNDNSISYTASEPVTYSLNMNEDIVVLDPGAQLSINVGDHAVLRSDHEKISFTPLQAEVAAHGEVAQSAQQLIGFELPEIYRSISTLHLSTSQTGKVTSNVCEVFILHKLLDTSRLEQITKILTEQNINFNQERSYIRVECVKRGAK